MINQFIHSYWTPPALNSRWGINSVDQLISNIWYYALSVTYLKLLGQRIILHTDQLGAELLSDIGYDDIKLTLSNLSKSNHSSIWACGKIKALECEPIGSIHIDGDVFIKSENCLNKIKSSTDLIIQCTEDVSRLPHPYNTNRKFIDHINLPFNLATSGTYAYNTGVLGIYNSNLKSEYIKLYLDLANQITNDNIYLTKIKDINWASIDVIIEQELLYNLCKNRYTVTNLLSSEVTITEDANKLGYQHVLGSHKYLEIEFCKLKLQQLNPTLYNILSLNELKFINKINEYLICQ